MLVKRIPMHRQVEEILRKKIANGEFSAGSRLPSISALSEMTGASVCTVHDAVGRLVREGLIERQARRAAFVRGGVRRLTSVGLFYSSGLFFSYSGSNDFYHILGREIQRKLELRGIQTRVWSDDRLKELQTEPPHDLRRAIERREVQAIIAPLLNIHNLGWLSELEIPVAALSGNPLATFRFHVPNLFQKMFSSAFESLKAQGCRRVGLISRYSPTKDTSSTNDICGAYLDLLKQHGMETRNEWIIVPPTGRPLVDSPHEYGYNAFRKLWGQKERPDGLIVYPDIAVMGTLMSIIEQRVNVPQELKLALHANDQISYPCPVPATLLVTRVGMYADGLIGKVDAAFEGREFVFSGEPVKVVQHTGSTPITQTLNEG